MNLPILKVSSSDLNGFINYWSKFYHYPLESLYNERIHNQRFDVEDIQQLFIWKNGMKLSASKQNSLLVNVLSKINIINELKTRDRIDVDEFQSHFKKMTAVWKIFLLHIIKPNSFPIYDQHINRAYNFIHELDFKNITPDSMTNKAKEDFYFNTYLGFIEKTENINLKELDEAFFAFGQLINTKTYIKIVS